jgi:hypothetical protein
LGTQAWIDSDGRICVGDVTHRRGISFCQPGRGWHEASFMTDAVDHSASGLVMAVVANSRDVEPPTGGEFHVGATSFPAVVIEFDRFPDSRLLIGAIPRDADGDFPGTHASIENLTFSPR